MLSRPSETPGQKRFCKLYGAVAAGLPVDVHAFGFGGYPVSGAGWPSYYIEDLVGHAQSSQSFLTSMVIEGVFERVPNLRLVLIEAGFAWVPSLAWRLDKIRNRLKVEEPANRDHVLDAIDWIDRDRLLFATDYPHWDYDDAAQVLPMRLAEQKKRNFFLDNAVASYGVR